jgi:hypothetical protein
MANELLKVFHTSGPASRCALRMDLKFAITPLKCKREIDIDEILIASRSNLSLKQHETNNQGFGSD